MAEISILIDGQPADPDAMPNLMHGMIVKSMYEQLSQKLSRAICPEHQAAPRVTVNIAGGRQAIGIAGCCQTLIDLTQRMLQAGP